MFTLIDYCIYAGKCYRTNLCISQLITLNTRQFTATNIPILSLSTYIILNAISIARGGMACTFVDCLLDCVILSPQSSLYCIYLCFDPVSYLGCSTGGVDKMASLFLQDVALLQYTVRVNVYSTLSHDEVCCTVCQVTHVKRTVQQNINQLFFFYFLFFFWILQSN